jgi:hypothetical protein
MGEEEQKRMNNQDLVALSMLVDRALLARASATQFNGDRDLYDILGYPPSITYKQFSDRYRREDISGKIVDLPPQDTWRKPPLIQDGEEDTSQQNLKSPFLQAVQYLIQKLRLWHYLQRVDRLSGIGRYGILLIGVRGASKLSEPLEAGSLSTAEDVLYFSPFTEGSASVASLVTDAADKRYRLPETYQVAMGEGLPSVIVHWTRVIHVAEDLDEDEIYGRPRLERVYNRLEDLLKVIGGGAEANWKNMDRGLHADVRDGFTLADPEALSDEIDEYIHGLRRFIRTEGVNVTPLGSNVVDPTGIFTAIISLISAASDIPQRILLGSERGELASSQDLTSWAGAISARQTQYAEPAILRQVIDRLIWLGAVPAPANGDYAVKWQTLFEMSDLQKAQIAKEYAQAISSASAGSPELIVPFVEFRERVLGWPAQPETEGAILDEEDSDEDEEEEPEDEEEEEGDDATTDAE